jgi:hypothetical protein
MSRKEEPLQPGDQLGCIACGAEFRVDEKVTDDCPECGSREGTYRVYEWDDLDWPRCGCVDCQARREDRG